MIRLLAVLVVALATGLAGVSAQGAPLAIEDMPLAQYGAVAKGGTVTPVYEGWYEHPDGGFVLYFGYYNRNTEEVVEVPVGPENAVTGHAEAGHAAADRASTGDAGQPTVFRPGRAWGVFGVVVPADFGERTVVWTLTANGATTAIPGHLRPDWRVPAVSGDVMGNRPPTLRLAPGGAEGQGPLGVWAAPRQAVVGRPVTMTVWASDDGTNATQFRRGAGAAAPITLTWLRHRGPGPVHFSEATGAVPNEGGSMETEVRFDRPGTYVVRVRANDDSGVSGAGNEQCCWTNAFVEFTVR